MMETFSSSHEKHQSYMQKLCIFFSFAGIVTIFDSEIRCFHTGIGNSHTGIEVGIIKGKIGIPCPEKCKQARPSNFQNMRGPKIIAPHSTGLVQKLEGKARNRTRAQTSLNKSSLAKLKASLNLSWVSLACLYSTLLSWSQKLSRFNVECKITQV